MSKKYWRCLIVLVFFALVFFPGISLNAQDDDIVIIDDEEEAAAGVESGDLIIEDGEQEAGGEDEYYYEAAGGEEWDEGDEGEFEVSELAETEEPLVYGEELYRPDFKLSLSRLERTGRVLNERKTPRYDGVIKRAYDSREMISTGDKIIITLRNASEVGIGEEFTIFRKGKLVAHPHSGKPIGYYIKNVGYLCVIEKKEGRILAVVKQVYDTVYIGNKLRSREVIKRQQAESNRPPRMPEAGEVRGCVVWTENSYASNGHIICLDRGADANLVPGLIVEIYNVPKGVDITKKDNGVRFAIGEIELIRVDRNTSMAVIVKAKDGIKVGQQAVLTISVE